MDVGKIMLRSQEKTPLLKDDDEDDCIIYSKTEESFKGLEEKTLHHDTNSRAVLTQIIMAGGVFLLGITAGFPAGFSAVLLPQLQHPNSSIYTDDNMASWIASIHSAATPFGAFVSGVLADKWGRRLALQFSVLPYVIGWTVISIATTHAVILVGRVMCGISVGLGAVPAHIMLAEVLEPRIRNFLAGIPYVSYSFGIFLVYIFGAMFNWRIASALGNIIPILTLIVFIFLPDSPVWLVRNNHYEEAEKALLWLRGGNTEKVNNEMEVLKQRACAENKTHTSRTGNSKYRMSDNDMKSSIIFINNSQPNKSSSSFCKLLKQPEILKPFLIVTVFNILQVFCGTYLVIFYAVTLVSDDTNNESKLSPFIITVFTGAIRFVFICIAVTVLFWVGRRKLAIISGFGSMITTFTLGTFFYLLEQGYDFQTYESWIICGLILLFVMANTVGFFILPGVSVGELLPVRIRGTAGGFIMGIFSLLQFLMAKIFPDLLKLLNRSGVFWFFGFSTFIVTLFLYLLFPEAKDHKLEEIEDYFKENNILYITRNKNKPKRQVDE